MRDGRVLIVGAGIAGPTLAYWLHAAGFRATLVERAPAPRSGGYVIDFWGLGYDVAERMGLRPAVEQAGYHVRELRIVDDHGARAAGFGVGVFRELTGGRYVSLRRSDLARLLLEALPPDIETVFGDEITALEDRGEAVDVRFRHGGARRFDLVFGADGLHSSVRGLAFGPEAAFERSLGYLVAAFETRGYRPRDEDVYVAHSTPGQQLARFALHDDRTLFLFIAAIDAAQLSPMPEPAAQRAVLRRLFGDGRWESAPDSGRDGSDRGPLLRSHRPDHDADMVARPRSAARRRGVLRLAHGRSGLRAGDDGGVCPCRGTRTRGRAARGGLRGL